MIVGIDLGTTNSLIGAMDAGFPVLFADENGCRLTPSALYFPEDATEPVVGWEALEHRETGVLSIKRLMGSRVGEVETTLPVVGRPGEPVRLQVGSQTLSPEEISAFILRKLKVQAERVLGGPVTKAVITVPAYFNDAQRSATKRAGELAGFEVERLLAEPTAAALAYGLDRLGEKSHVAVYDLGGGTFDISVLELSGGVFQVLATNGDTRLGGDDFDRAIAEKFGISLAEAEARKREGGEQIAEVCRPILEKTRLHCLRSLHDAKVDVGQLDEVILVGGSTRMPLVREFVREVFGKEPNVSQHPDEAVALGAAIQAGILSGSVQNVTLLDVTPLSLGIETFGGLMNVLIPRNTTIPCRAGEMFANAAANQTSMRITVLQGEREMARDNWKLGEFVVSFAPAPRGQARVGVQFEIDANGLLQVLARDIATGVDTKVAIESAVEVSDEAVEKMLEDSLEHAFEDMDERVFTEATIKADEMLPAVDKALAALGDKVPESDRAAILAAAGAVRSAKAEKSLSKLKAALADLDRLTEPLAAQLIELAMGS
ncbi:molecular chaperone DNAK [Terrimicrobium sacchariphilum]|uniref:Molecular chaperone DNAK n=1 Tax=Terrimicrobium sacchariphilum TaxID=690879 RepID=A0A146G5I5_TERSA|nr:Hsp70 family protein [Terrimicrobium sacchariphilum]GAT32860.1 molecular chaperone DNAK [Terrimicrobium sacchariphilum]